MKTPKKVDGYVAVKTENGYALYNESENKVIEISPEILVVWLLCDGQKDIDQIVDEIIGDQLPPNVTREMVAKDVLEILKILEDNHLIQ